MNIRFVRPKLNNPFSALKHRNFRFYWMGMCVSLIGTWMQNIAQPWLAYSITRSAFLLSLVSALQFLPMLLFSLFAGVLIDRFPKKKILLLTQSASLMITLMLAILVWSGHIQYWHILISAFAIGVVNTLDLPTRQSFVIELVGKEDLMNAVALNMSVFNLARILGPAIAGIVIRYGGIAACFYINSISFAAVIIGLLLIKRPITPIRTLRKKMTTDILDGIKYIYQNDNLKITVLTSAIVGTFAMNFNVLVPVYTKVVLNKQETGFGFLMSFMGLGALIGAMSIATMSESGPQKIILNFGPLMIAAFLIITGNTGIYALTALSLALTSLFITAFSSTANSFVQLSTMDEFRGRVMSVYSFFFNGFTPIGSLYTGIIIHYFGPKAGFMVNGITIILLIFVLQPFKRKEIRKKSKIIIT